VGVLPSCPLNDFHIFKKNISAGHGSKIPPQKIKTKQNPPKSMVSNPNIQLVNRQTKWVHPCGKILFGRKKE
jgi:hypothetical protein